MASITGGNWSFRDPQDDIPNGSIIEAGNFYQFSPGTIILSGKELTINGGNWVNVRPDPLWTINGGNWSQISFCTNINSQLIDKGLKACEENCEHVVEIDTLVIDGEVVDTVYHYQDKNEGPAWQN